MSQTNSRKKTQYERGHEAAKRLTRERRIIHGLMLDGLLTAEALFHGLLGIAWRRGYDAARRDQRRNAR